MRLKAPRLLTATIGAMGALLVVKSITLVQAAAEEPGGGMSAQAEPADAAKAAAMPAGATPGKAPPDAATGAAPVAPGAMPMAEAAKPTPPMSDGERSVLMALRERREALDGRARALDQRSAELAAANKRLEERVTQLTALQTRLEGMEATRQTHRAENWSGLVKTYEAMKPREAAAIFDALDMQVLLQVLDRMQERRAAPVLAAMQPDRARLATQMLAEMRTRSITPPEPAPMAVAPGPAPKG